MSKICIVFDRLRTEEKMLEKEVKDLNHDSLLIDAKSIQFNTDSKLDDFDFGNIVLQRCISYFRGLHFTSCLEFLECPVLNKFLQIEYSIVGPISQFSNLKHRIHCIFVF